MFFLFLISFRVTAPFSMERTRDSAPVETSDGSAAKGGKMHILLVYYSLTGNTKQIATKIAEKLKACQIEEVRVEPQKDYKNKFSLYLVGGFRATKGIRVPIKPAKSDLKDYDLLILGFPIWGGKSPSPVLTYIDGLTNCKDKKVIAFASSGGGNENYKTSANKILEAKGLNIIESFSFQSSRISEKELNKIAELVGTK